MVNYQKIMIMLLVASYCISGSVMAVKPVTGAEEGTSTSIAVWPTGYYFLEGWEIQLEIIIWDADGQVVNTGELHVEDLNGSTSIDTAITDQTTLVSWTAVTDGLTGIHVFEVTYSDPENHYLSCSVNQELLIGIEIGIGETGMNLETNYPVFNVVRNQQVNPAGSLSSNNPVFPYFYIDSETACLSVEVEIMGNWKIVDIQYPSTGLITTFSFNFAFILPPWVPTGAINARYVFSGSFISDLDSATAYFTVNLLPAEKTIVLLLQESVIERSNLTEQNILPLAVQVPGFDDNPVMLDLDLLTLDGYLVKNLLSDHLLTSYLSELPLEIPSDVVIGTYNLSATLIDATVNSPLASAGDIITVVDELLVDNFYWNITGQSVQPGQQVSGHLVSREEDTFSGVKSHLLVQVIETGMVLFNSTTGENGYTAFSFLIPSDFPAGYNDISFNLSPLLDDLYHVKTVLTREVVFQQETTITHQESLFLVRKKEGWFNATVVDAQGFPVPQGSLSLVLDGSIIHESTVPSTGYKFNVPEDTPIGINFFTWQYMGSSMFRESQQMFPVAVYSVPALNNLSSTALETFPGEAIEINGRLVEETGSGIPGAPININHLDNWGQSSPYTVVTGTNGYFTFTYLFENESLGTHFFTVEFNGWTEEYYLPVDGKPVFELAIIPRVTLLVNEALVAGENGTLEFHGKPDQEIAVEILEDGNWVQLVNFRLDTSGKLIYEWSIPSDLKGEILIRAGYTGDIDTAIFTLTILVRPQLDIQLSESPVLTGEEIKVLVTCNEEHTLYKDGKIWQDKLSPGTRQFTLVFNEPGDHEIEVVASGSYTVLTTEKLIIQVRNNYTVTVDMPSRVQRSVGAVIAFTISDERHFPLEGFKIEFSVNETLVATAMSSQTGTATLTLTLAVGSYQPRVEILPKEPAVFISKQLVLDSLTVYSVPIVEISDVQPVRGRSVNVETRVTDGHEPLFGEAIQLYLKNTAREPGVLIGGNITDDQGVAVVAWNVTEESGDYFLLVETTGSQFIEPVVVTKAVKILESGPEIVSANVITQNDDKNLYIITALVDFPAGKKGVYLYSGKGINLIGELNLGEDLWTLAFQLEKGTHELWLQAVDSQDIDAWKSLGMITAINDLSGVSENTSPSKNTKSIVDAVKDSLITAVFMLPVVVFLVYRKRKGMIRN
ncbi:MAG: carboxypeptidase-like regulatory domain-containing protein [Candidatus Odinarchaeota archaeon]